MLLYFMLLAEARGSPTGIDGGLLCPGGAALTSQILRGVNAAGPPGPHGSPATNPNCTKELVNNCPLKNPHSSFGPSHGSGGDDAVGCLGCTVLHAGDLGKKGKCTEADKTNYCFATYLQVHKLSGPCAVAIYNVFGDLWADKSNMDDPEYATPAKALSSFGSHVDDPGQYYTCNSIEGYSYWKVAWAADPTGKNSSHGHGGGGGHGRRLQHHHHYHEGGCYGEQEMGVCLPDECSTQQVHARVHARINM